MVVLTKSDFRQLASVVNTTVLQAMTSTVRPDWKKLPTFSMKCTEIKDNQKGNESKDIQLLIEDIAVLLYAYESWTNYNEDMREAASFH